MNPESSKLCKQLGIQFPIFCGAMYPCSNLELLVAVAKAGAMPVVQPLSLVYVYEKNLKSSLHTLRQSGAYGFNVLTEASSSIYLDRMRKWVDIALEEGCRFFVSALGNPRWIVDRVRSSGGIVFHDCTNSFWAKKALDAGVHGLICVNNNAGGHAGTLSAEKLYEDLKGFGVPLICAGGLATDAQIQEALQRGYAGVQLGTRFIATEECAASLDYKKAILSAGAEDIGLTERITGVPVSVILTDEIKRQGTHAGRLMRWMLKHPRLKHWARLWYSLRSFRSLKKSMRGHKEYWQAGKSAASIDELLTVEELFSRWSKFRTSF
jgi:nitronate monooxygenase